MHLTRTHIIVITVILAVLIVCGWFLLNNSSRTMPPYGPRDGRSTTQSKRGQRSPAPVVTTSAETFTLADIAAHNTQDNCWFAVDGIVYDLTGFISNGMHKGGMDVVIANCGTDASATFTQVHEGKKLMNASHMLGERAIGTLAE